MDDELKALFNYYSYKLEIIERNRQLEQQMFYAELECMQEQFNDVYLYEPVNDCTNTVDDSVEEFEQQTTFTCSTVELTLELVTQPSPQAHELADSPAIKSYNKLANTTSTNSLGESLPASDQRSFSLCAAPFVHLCINKHTTVNTLTCYRGIPSKAPSDLAGYETCYRIWNPGLCFA